MSEDPAIEVLAPRDGEVWATATELQWLSWFPRDCARACRYAGDETTGEDVERWLDGDRSRREAAIDSAWLERLRTVRLYAHRLPADSFEPWDTFFISSETVAPLELVELRIAPALGPLWERVLETTPESSGIRLRNAVRQ